ncbi:Uncharacterised protein [Pragia fontium]|uniref:DUF6896 domain-containing protein n=1 Tax=Pragia fontium TaxID=82985 RepID=UPI000E002375|nr:hypothetical protein [Pragia fontium]SUB83923.1 Uncharacterised protein [Pragia fontium]
MVFHIDTNDIIGFVRLQKGLMNAFFIAYPIVKDFTWLLDFPKSGNIKLDHDLWSFIKHGKGIKFLKRSSQPEIVVDVSTNINNPNMIDVWRLSQYFLSNLSEVSDSEIKCLLDEMVYSGLLKKTSEKQYELI